MIQFVVSPLVRYSRKITRPVSWFVVSILNRFFLLCFPLFPPLLKCISNCLELVLRPSIAPDTCEVRFCWDRGTGLVPG